MTDTEEAVASDRTTVDSAMVASEPLPGRYRMNKYKMKKYHNFYVGDESQNNTKSKKILPSIYPAVHCYYYSSIVFPIPRRFEKAKLKTIQYITFLSIVPLTLTEIYANNKICVTIPNKRRASLFSTLETK